MCISRLGGLASQTMFLSADLREVFEMDILFRCGMNRSEFYADCFRFGYVLSNVYSSGIGYHLISWARL